MSDVIELNQPDQLDRLIAEATAAGCGYRAEIYRAVRASRIVSMELRRHAVAPMGILKRAPLPALVLLGDDDYASTGPAGWACFPRLLRWARGALIHASGGDVHTYRMAIGMALEAKRFLLIEADTAHADEWEAAFLEAVPVVPFLKIIPSDGVQPRPGTGPKGVCA